jgi:hypothetical protein
MKTSMSASASQDDEASARGFSRILEETISNKFGRLLRANRHMAVHHFPNIPSWHAPIQRPFSPPIRAGCEWKKGMKEAPIC